MEIIQGNAPIGVFNPTRNDQARIKTETVLEGIVVDIIKDHQHREYGKADGYNVGAAKIRIFSVHDGVNSEALPWAFPIDSTVVEYPLINELVTIQNISGVLFYSKKVPIARRVQENVALKLEDRLNNRNANSIKKSVQQGQQLNPQQHLFGKYFKPDSRVRPLKHFEGDVVIQSRLGSSIRMGSSAQEPTSKGLAPSLILRTGQAKNIENEASTDSVFGLITENIERDASSIWITTDQKVPFAPITRTIGSYARSFKSPVESIYDGAQIFINSDRVVLNAKKTNILLFAKGQIYLNSYKQIGIDSDGNIEVSSHKEISLESNGNIKIASDADVNITSGDDLIIASSTKTSIFGNKIFVGSSNNSYEPMVGGTSLSIFLARLILTLMGNGITPPQLPYQTTGAPIPPLSNVLPKIATPGIATAAHVIVVPGAPGVPVPAPLNPAIATGLAQLYTELVLPNLGSTTPIPFSGAPFNSSDIFTVLATEDTSQIVQRNEFSDGEEPITIENNSYKLSDDYYRVL